jgi:hypothetical protein
MKVKFKPEVLEIIKDNIKKVYNSYQMFLITHDGSNIYYSKEFDVPFMEVVDSMVYNTYYQIQSPINIAGLHVYKKHVIPYYNFTIELNEDIF